MNKRVLLISALMFFASIVFAQEKTEKEEGNKGFHQLGFMLSHSRIGTGVVNGAFQRIAVPSLGFDYNYWFKNKWAVGVHTDLIAESFKVQENGGIINERSTPFSAVPAICFKPKEHSVFIVGIGEEFAKEGNYTMNRFGYEYAFELPKRYELSFGITYDIKWKAYDTWTVGIIVSKLFK